MLDGSADLVSLSRMQLEAKNRSGWSNVRQDWVDRVADEMLRELKLASGLDALDELAESWSSLGVSDEGGAVDGVLEEWEGLELGTLENRISEADLDGLLTLRQVDRVAWPSAKSTWFRRAVDELRKGITAAASLEELDALAVNWGSDARLGSNDQGEGFWAQRETGADSEPIPWSEVRGQWGGRERALLQEQIATAGLERLLVLGRENKNRDGWRYVTRIAVE